MKETNDVLKDTSSQKKQVWRAPEIHRIGIANETNSGLYTGGDLGLRSASKS